eukprot:504555-Lingulodinium_polyedra.AAC.1
MLSAQFVGGHAAAEVALGTSTNFPHVRASIRRGWTSLMMVPFLAFLIARFPPTLCEIRRCHRSPDLRGGS